MIINYTFIVPKFPVNHIKEWKDEYVECWDNSTAYNLTWYKSYSVTDDGRYILTGTSGKGEPSSTSGGYYIGVGGCRSSDKSYEFLGSISWWTSRADVINKYRAVLVSDTEEVSSDYSRVVGNYTEGYDSSRTYFFELVETDISPVKVVELNTKYEMQYEYYPDNYGGVLITRAINIQNKDKYSVRCTGFDWNNNVVSISGDGTQWTSVSGQDDMTDKIANSNWNNLYIKVEGAGWANYLKVEYVIE